MTDGAKTILDAIAASLRKAGAYNRDDQASPVAVLWTDRERQWTPLVARLRTMLPLFTLGPYDPEQGIGPAYWLRFALGSGDLDGRAAFEANGALPVVYLPGISRSQLRAVEECAPELRPIAELQYRSAFWSHRNGRDWTVPAFLSSADGGLGIETGGDVATRDALLLTLPLLADIPLSRLRRELPLRAEYFLAVANPDEARAILEWLDEPTSFRRSREDQAWEAFRQQAVRQFGFDPETDDPIEADTLLGGREDGGPRSGSDSRRLQPATRHCPRCSAPPVPLIGANSLSSRGVASHGRRITMRPKPRCATHCSLWLSCQPLTRGPR